MDDDAKNQNNKGDASSIANVLVSSIKTEQKNTSENNPLDKVSVKADEGKLTQMGTETIKTMSVSTNTATSTYVPATTSYNNNNNKTTATTTCFYVGLGFYALILLLSVIFFCYSVFGMYDLNLEITFFCIVLILPVILLVALYQNLEKINTEISIVMMVVYAGLNALLIYLGTLLHIDDSALIGYGVVAGAFLIGYLVFSYWFDNIEASKYILAPLFSPIIGAVAIVLLLIVFAYFILKGFCEGMSDN